MAPSQHTPPIIMSMSKDRTELPQWVATELDTAREAVVQLEVTSSSQPLYSILCLYFAQRAVDIRQAPPSEADRIHNNPLRDKREFPGNVTTLFCSPDAKQNWDRYRHSEDDEDGLPHIEYGFGLGWARIRTNNKLKVPVTPEFGVNNTPVNEAAAPKVNGTSENSDANANANHVAPTTSDAVEEIEVEEADVIIEHIARGEPFTVCYRPTLFRQIVLHAAKEETIRAIVKQALLWHRQHEKRLQQAKPGKFVLFTLRLKDETARWISQGYRKSRPLTSVILPKDTWGALLGDFEEFNKKETKEWYIEHGLPYRRSYLFHGPPGVGKTSTIKALAGHLKMKACFMSLSHPTLTDQLLHEAFSRIPKPCIVVLEDVDVLFNMDRKSETKSQMSFSGLLNAIDGIVSPDGTIMVMTTNHIDRLDPALVRAGRVDRRFEFKLPTMEDVEQLFKSFYPHAPEKLSSRFARDVFDRKEKQARSIATLQQHFIFTRTLTAEESLNKLDDFFKSFFPHGAYDGKAVLYV